MKAVLSTPSPGEIQDNIAMLYELSLGIGTSLNLQENCEFFVQKLMSRQNLSFVAIYADVALQDLSSQIVNSDKQYSCIYTCPGLPAHELEQVISTEMRQRIQAQGMLSINTQESETTIQSSPIFQSFPGIFSAFSIAQNQIIVVCINQVRQCEYPKWQLSQLHLLLNKFGCSVEACLNHKSLQQATQAKIALEKKLGKAQHLESLGLMASGIAHDLGNILNPLTAYPPILKSAFAEGSREEMMLLQIQAASDKAHAMMRDLLMLSQKSRRYHTAISLAEPVFQYQNSASFISLQSAEPNINCRWQLDSDSQVLADNTMITRIVMNLVTNAFDAIHGRGDVEIFVKDYDIPTPYEGYMTVPAGQYVALVVQDNGEGIPHDALAHIFDPFFSKKTLGRSGSGLGLATVHSIVEGLNGMIDVKTGTKGTSFIVYFPRLLATQTMTTDAKSSQP
ncbi:hypothetical protein IQ266_07780 [filamentous cyanobacterium LEGE 11480]|uniref:histidine kinase n=1 Tax=Romeriopsis navalis LEGE 11480 TaxID=2777977 RepID=A0A928Z324_9CYAN|nr:ATP-binding protein [Romeriopsis navalis]MBE9029627.1 hypothetical protein [Romeriopsis navalis LEGE 11480]